MRTVIIPCKCKHEYQDKKYGDGKRVHNVGGAGKEASCTVCSSTKPVST